jgi:hypothetical protein
MTAIHLYQLSKAFPSLTPLTVGPAPSLSLPQPFFQQPAPQRFVIQSHSLGLEFLTGKGRPVPRVALLVSR